MFKKLNLKDQRKDSGLLMLNGHELSADMAEAEDITIRLEAARCWPASPGRLVGLDSITDSKTGRVTRMKKTDELERRTRWFYGRSTTSLV